MLDFDSNKLLDDVNLLDSDRTVILDYGCYKVMVDYRNDRYEITDYYVTKHECGDRSYVTDDIEEVLPVCVYYATEAKERAQLENSFNLASVS